MSGLPGLEPRPGQLLVRVRAAGLNRADLLEINRAGRSAVGGRELAGEIIAVGADVGGWRVGQRVMGRGRGFAAEAVVDAALAVAVPDDLSDEEAGGLPVALTTMHDALVTHGRMAPGDRVLVHAATSGVGVTGVQMAAALGAGVVFATSRSAAKLDDLRRFLGSLDTDVVGIDTSTTAFERVAGDVAVIVDNVGASVLAGNIAAAAVRGRIVQVGRLGGRTAEIDLDELARKRIELIGVTFRTRTRDETAEVTRAAVADLGHRLSEVRPRIHRSFPLARLDDAFAELARNEHIGKIIVVP